MRELVAQGQRVARRGDTVAPFRFGAPGEVGVAVVCGPVGRRVVTVSVAGRIHGAGSRGSIAR